MIYNIFILPLEIAFKFIYTTMWSITGSYGVSLIFMSVCTSILIYPFMKYASRAQAKEKHIRDVLGVQIEKINSESSGAERHRRIVNLYSRYSYHPIYSIRSATGVFLQVPFLLGAYYMLSNFAAIQGQSFGFIKNLAAPDMLLFGTVNLLPILMTVINIFAAITTPNFGRKDIIQAMVIALLFLVLLYDAPSALLIFWTFNNLWVLLGNYKQFPQMGTSVRNFPMPSSRFWGIAYAALFLITFQANLAFFCANGLDTKQGLFALLSGILLFIYSSIYIALERKSFVSKIIPFFMFIIISGLWVFWLVTSSELEKISVFVEIPEIIREFAVHTKAVIEMEIGLHPSHILSIVQFISSFILLLLFCKKDVHFKEQKGSNYLVLLLFMIAPATFQLGNNLAYVSSSTVWIYYAVLIALGFLVYFSLRLLFSSIVQKESLLVSCAFIFALILNPTIQALLKRFGSTSIVFIPSFLVVLLIILNFGKKLWRPMLAILGVITVGSMIGIFFNDDSSQISGGNSEHMASTELADRGAQNFPQISPNDRVNVYFLVYDSTPDLRTLDNLGIDSNPLADLLNSHGFNIYNNTYTLFPQSLVSMSSTYSIMDKPYDTNIEKQRACAGDSIVFELFSNNSYKTSSIQDAYMTGGRMFVDEYFPLIDLSYSQFESTAIFIRGILSGEFRFDAVGLSTTSEEEYHKFLRDKTIKDDKPWFTAMHVGKPGHSQNSGKLLPNETELYKNRFEAALKYIDDDIESIILNDPNAVIVALGDHGPYLTGDGLFLVGYDLTDITELMIRDRFGTLIAIRWPDQERAAKYDKDLLVNQDIFPVVFAYLMDSAEPLKLMIKEKNANLKGHTFLDNGVFIPYQE